MKGIFMHIAILCTSNDVSDFALRHETDDIKYANIIKKLRPDWKIDRFAVWKNSFPENIKHYDGVIITGSPASVHDDEAWIERLIHLICTMNEQKIPLFGGCFGHQAIAKALGGEVGYNLKGEWSVGKENTKFFEGTPFGLSNQDISLYSIHKEEVFRLPKNAKAIGENDFCKYPAFMINDHILSSQYHPEMTKVFLLDLLNELVAVLPDDKRMKAQEEFEEGHQGEEFMNSVIKFFESQS